MSFADAAFHTVHDYPGGAVSLAPRLGSMPPKVLSNKVNPHCDTNELTLKEASRLMAMTGDYRILHALCQEHGHAAIQLVDGPIGDLSVLERITTIWKEVGDVGQTVQRILSDSKVEKREVAELANEVQEAIEALLALKVTLEELQE